MKSPLFKACRSALVCGIAIAVTVPVAAQDVTVTIGDIKGFIDNAAELGSAVVPQFQPAMIKGQAGAMLSDPELKGLPEGSGALVIVTETQEPIVFLEVSQDMRTKYRETIANVSKMESGEAEGLIIFGKTADSVKTGEGMAAKAKAKLDGKGQPTITADVKLAELIKKNEPIIKSWTEKIVKQTAVKTGETSGTKGPDLEAVAEVYIKLGQKTETLSLTFAPNKNGLFLDIDAVPIGGKVLDFSGKCDLAKLSSAIPDGVAMRGEMCITPEAIKSMPTEFLEVYTKMFRSSKITSEVLKEHMSQWADLWVGGMAFGMYGVSDSFMSGVELFPVKDEKKALELSKTMFDLFSGESTKPLEPREHDGVKITRFDAKGMFAAMGMDRSNPAFEKMMKDQEFVFETCALNGTAIIGFDSKSTDYAIDTVKKGAAKEAKPLLSKSNLPPGGFAYFDYDMEKFMGVMQKMGGQKSPMPADLFKGAVPIQGAAYAKSDKYRVSLLVPTSFMKSVAASAGQAKPAPKKGIEMEDSVIPPATIKKNTDE
jgi:hypothetical protein